MTASVHYKQQDHLPLVLTLIVGMVNQRGKQGLWSAAEYFGLAVSEQGPRR